MRIVILSTMLTDRRGIGEWGFAALVEAGGHRLLFDTGARPDTVLRNAEALSIDLGAIEDVVLSHAHWDHTGGLVPLRRELRGRHPSAMSRAHVAPGFFTPRTRGGKPFSLTTESCDEYRALGGAFVVHERPEPVCPGVWITGPVQRRHAESNFPRDIVARTPDGDVMDEVPEDASLVLGSPAGLVVLTGCGHAGVVNTVEAAQRIVPGAKVSALVGGLHLYDADDATLEWTGKELRRLGVEHLLGTHCTGIEAVFRLRAAAGLDRRTCVVGSVGSSYEAGRGIDPGGVAR